MVCLLFGNTAFESNVSEQTKKTTFPREGKDAACLVSHWLILPFLDSWIWLSYSTYHRIQNKFAQVRGLARPTVVVAVTRAGFPFQHWVTGTEYPASLDSGLFSLPSAQGKEGRNNHLRANSWQRCPAWGQAGRESPHSTLHPEGGRTGRVSGKHPPRGWGDARPRHLPTYQKQLPGSQEQAIPAHQLSVRAHCPSQHGWVFQKARQGSGCSCYCPTFLFFFFLIFLVYFYWVWEKGINTVLFWCLTHLPVSSPSLADSIIHLPDTTIVWFIWHMHQKKMSCSEQEHNAVISFPSQTPQQLHSTSHFLLL